MKKIIFLTLTYLLFFNFSYSKNTNELYGKIDLFGEVLEKVKELLND